MFGTDLRGKKQPIGVTTNRVDGQYIKICLEPYGDNWLRVSIPRKTKEIINELDIKGDSIRGYERPLDGMRLLDRLIIDFYRDEMDYPQHAAERMPAKFKEVGGFDGQSKYSFSNFFTSIAMAEKQNDKLDARKKIREKELEAWEKRVLEVGEDGAGKEPLDYNFDADKEEIRELSDKEIEGLSRTMDDALVTLRRGVTFTGEQKNAYWGAILESEKWHEEYRLMPEIAEERNNMDDTFARAFKGKHDWIVKETFDSIIENNFDKYFDQYRDQIMIDEGKRISEEYNLDLSGDTVKFYGKFYGIMHELKDFEIDALAKLRFKTKSGKNLSGKWKAQHIAILENTELISQDLPLGHLLNNPKVKSFSAPNFSEGQGYAYYTPMRNSISFSKEYMDIASEEGHLTDPLEFFAVTPHEIGHAVSDYYRHDIHPLGYKYWISECGWDNRQDKLDATGSDRNVERLGENRHIPLITEYANKSPEEAFAEYYSCYYQNKESIDNWLDTDDPSFLSENKRPHMTHINFWKDDVQTGKTEKMQMPTMSMEHGIYYRGDVVNESTMLLNRNLFSFMKEYIFNSTQIKD